MFGARNILGLVQTCVVDLSQWRFFTTPDFLKPQVLWLQQWRVNPNCSCFTSSL